jgi:uncharacterized protein YijF (DUF1287 family)
MMHGNGQVELAAILMARKNRHRVIREAAAIALLLPLLVFVFAGRADCGSAGDLVEAARDQIGKTVSYDPRYQVLGYPDGDIPIGRGVCSDVIIRAMRASLHLDLQKLVHEDMQANFSRYPRRWGLNQPDKNIDHRRVPNLRTYFDRSGWSLEVSNDAGDYTPGDIVTCIVPRHRPHIMIVSDLKNRDGVPFVIHNIGAGVREEDRLFEFEITGHYRITGIDPNDSL